MNIKEQDIAILHRLGLTPVEAKIFLISSKIGRQKIERIATLADIDRSNTYNIIRKLQNIGLTNEILGKPNLYESLPVKEAVSILLISKENEFKSIEREANSFVDSNNLEAPNDIDSGIFKIIKRPKKAMQQSVIKRLENAKQCFDLLINEKIFTFLFVNLATEQLNCVKRGVNYRIITENKTLDKFKTEIIPFKRSANFEIRGLSQSPQVCVIIMDEDVATLHLLTNIDSEMQMLQTNHRGCVKIFQSYFDKVWGETQEYKF
jgi:sugar-specific transcriptional regulator TrmB